MPFVRYDDLGGGVNQGKPPSGLKDNEFVSMSNFYPFGTKLKRRGGCRRLNTDELLILDTSPSLWLKADSLSYADGADVTSWEDSSGNGRDLDTSTGTQTFKDAYLNGKPVVQFGDDGYLSAASSAVQMDDLLDSSGRGLILVVGWCDTTHTGYDALWSSGAGPTRGCFVDTSDDIMCRAYDGTADDATLAGTYDGGWHLFVWQYDGTNVSSFGNDLDDASAATAASGAQTGLATDFRLGGDGINELQGYIAEVIVIPGVVSENTRLRLASVMNEKYGLNSAEQKERLTGVYPYRPSVTGTVTTILGSLTKLRKLNGTAITDIPAQTGFTVGSSTKQWVFFEYKDILYAFRESSNQLIRCDGSYYGPAGITAPATACTLAEGAAGAITAADYYGVYTFYNSATNVESNPSTASAKLTHSGTKKIDWSGIAVSTNQQVDSRRLYRTLPDNTGEYYYVDTIDNNFDTTYTGDNVLVQDMGRAVSFFNGTPPTGLLFGAVWKERLFVTDGNLVYYSESGLIECFDDDSYIPVYPDDGHEIRAIHAFGDRLVIGKTNKIHYLVGTDPAYFALLTLSDAHGCAAHHTMKSAEGLLFWLGLDNVYRSDGNSVKGIASVKLETLFETATPAQLEAAFAWVYPALNWYVLVVPSVGEYIYNYKTDAWTEVSTLSGISAGDIHYDDNFGPENFVCDAYGNVYRFNDPNYDYDDDDTTLKNSITATFTTKEMDQGNPGFKAVMLRVALLSDQYAESVTLTWEDFEGTTVNSRTVSLDYDEPWKVYALSTRRQAKSNTRLKLTYSGTAAIELQGFGVDGSTINRMATRAH